MSIGLIMLIIWICFVFWVVFLIWGIILCNNSNNALGVLLLFLTLNVFGLIIGFSLLYNNKNKQTVAMEKKYLSENID